MKLGELRVGIFFRHGVHARGDGGIEGVDAAFKVGDPTTSEVSVFKKGERHRGLLFDDGEQVEVELHEPI